MLIVTKNTYPKSSIGQYPVGTLCNWRIFNDELLLTVCNSDGTFQKKRGHFYAINIVAEDRTLCEFYENIFTAGNDINNPRVGLVAQHKNWKLEINLFNKNDKRK